MRWGLDRAAAVRIAPMALFMALLALRGAVPADGSWGFDPRWVYAVSTVAVGALLLWWWKDYVELARASWPSLRELLLSLAVGIAVFVAWIHLDYPWMRLGEATAGFRPVDARGDPMWSLIAFRWIGAALVVPVMEELFWRAWLMRWLVSPRFEAVVPRAVTLKAVVLTTFVFMLAHTLWLGAIVAGLAYAWLYIRTGRLWTAVIAHAVTNGILGVWVVLTGNWGFW